MRIVFVQESEYDLYAEHGFEGIELVGECGVRMKVNEGSTGKWYLKANATKGITYHTMIEINVKDSKEIEPSHVSDIDKFPLQYKNQCKFKVEKIFARIVI